MYRVADVRFASSRSANHRCVSWSDSNRSFRRRINENTIIKPGIKHDVFLSGVANEMADDTAATPATRLSDPDRDGSLGFELVDGVVGGTGSVTGRGTDEGDRGSSTIRSEPRPDTRSVKRFRWRGKDGR